jgi:hypothetical protein
VRGSENFGSGSVYILWARHPELSSKHFDQCSGQSDRARKALGTALIKNSFFLHNVAHAAENTLRLANSPNSGSRPTIFKFLWGMIEVFVRRCSRGGSSEHAASDTRTEEAPMKKIVVAGLVAVSLLAIANQPASAWVNARFGVGLNWNLQSGANNWLWGAWRNGQIPGPDAFYQDGPQYSPEMYMPPAHSSQYTPAPSHAYGPQAPLAYQFASYPGYYYYPMPYYNPSCCGR